MAQDNQSTERKLSVSVSIRFPSLTKEQAQALEDAIRDVCDDYPNADVQVMRNVERQSVRQ